MKMAGRLRIVYNVLQGWSKVGLYLVPRA